MTDDRITKGTALFCAAVLAYFILMTAPIILPVLIASIAELIKVII